MAVPSPQLVALGATIRRARRSLDLSQEALADRAGLSYKHVGEIERANKDPRITTVFRLASALELRAGELFARYDERLDGGAPLSGQSTT
ncbi:MAG TPA: helix-turn-helix transcriptional regulator [Conexibacter sp.]|jgi:transcriptional regulator with XRE-family HTH domain|nr:helix-turn-helix transcriptional regulator [Conexibacter sp.]